jgi:DNA-binding transcriptional ArsR family regulator
MDSWIALGDPMRRAIFEHLAERPRAVGELAGELPVSRPAVSRHLKVLKDAGLVIDQAAGTRRIYRLNPEGPGASDPTGPFLESGARHVQADRRARNRRGGIVTTKT